MTNMTNTTNGMNTMSVTARMNVIQTKLKKNTKSKEGPECDLPLGPTDCDVS